LEHEIRGKMVKVGMDGLLQIPGLDSVKPSNITAEQYALAPDQQDCLFDPFWKFEIVPHTRASSLNRGPPRLREVAYLIRGQSGRNPLEEKRKG